MVKTSKIPNFHTFPMSKKWDILRFFSKLTKIESDKLFSDAGLNFLRSEGLIENVVSVMSLPVGVATNFLINGKDYFIPMVTEEASVVAAASFAAKFARCAGGFKAEISSTDMVGQIVLVKSCSYAQAVDVLTQYKQEILQFANKQDPVLVFLGGGARDITIRQLKTDRGVMLVFHIIVDVKDAMGANIVNTMAESIAPLLEKLCGGLARLKIVSNFSPQRLVRAWATWPYDVIGPDVVEGILDADALAMADQYRATTHNKGIMNGVTAVALATGNDTRALEAGAHSFAAKNGVYQPLTRYRKNDRGDLEGFLEMPIAVGTVGGMTIHHPLVPLILKVLRVESARELACVMGAVGLAQNFAALRALVTEGIQKGHVRLHARKGAL
ncbi:MAG: hydroxymethylglutaryl-CoA reductase, degradative [bacterium]